MTARWRKSTHSYANGNCVECAPGPGATWRKATASTSHGACVEVAGWHTSSHSESGNCVQAGVTPEAASGYMIAVRDSKDPDGPHLAFAAADWQQFVDGLKGSPEV